MVINPTLQFRVLNRDDFTCQYCGSKAPDVPIEVDHILARENGGVDSEENLVTACAVCNIGKRDKPYKNAEVHAMNSADKYVTITDAMKIFKREGVTKSRSWFKMAVLTNKIRSEKYATSRVLYKIDVEKVARDIAFGRTK